RPGRGVEARVVASLEGKPRRNEDHEAVLLRVLSSPSHGRAWAGHRPAGADARADPREPGPVCERLMRGGHASGPESARSAGARRSLNHPLRVLRLFVFLVVFLVVVRRRPTTV